MDIFRGVGSSNGQRIPEKVELDRTVVPRAETCPEALDKTSLQKFNKHFLLFEVKIRT